MLIRFKVANFLSFKDETEFSMVAGKERIHTNHVIKGKRNEPNLLRAALLYGANAAGKSNFVKAIDFARRQILRTNVRRFSDFPFNLNYFKLNDSLVKEPSSFVFEFISNSKIYEYGFKIFNDFVQEEWLKDLSKDKLLFKRKTSNKEKTTFEKNQFLDKQEDKQFLEFVEKSLIPTQLFLTHCIENNVEWFRDAFDWFENSLTVIFPNTVDEGLEERLNASKEFKDFFTSFMQKAGTGISDVMVSPMKRRNFFNRIKQWSLFAKEEIIEEEEFETVLRMYLSHEGQRSDKITFFTKHDESDGTQRLFDLILPFYELMKGKKQKVFVIDELERSLHANMTFMLMRSYLENCHEHNNQMIATTHQTHLLDLDVLRRDEIWFAEKNNEGATELYSLYEFNPRYDKKIEKEYLTGRFGAIPFLGNLEFKGQLGENGKSKK